MKIDKIAVMSGLVAGLFLTACETIKSKEDSKESTTPKTLVFNPPKPHTPTKTLVTDEIGTLKYSQKTKTDVNQFSTLSRQAEQASSIKAAPFYEKWIKKDAKAQTDMALKFDALPIADVIHGFSKELGFDYILDPQVSGAVTMVLESKLDKRKAWELLEQILWMSGAYCAPIDDEQKRIHIMPFSKMPQDRRLLYRGKGTGNVEVGYINILHASSTDISAKLKSFLSQGATIIDLPKQNSLLIIESPKNLPKLRAIIQHLDKKNMAGWPRAVIPCVNIPASHIIEELNSVLPILGFPVSEGPTAEQGGIQLTSIDRVQVIIATAANNEAIKELKKWVNNLDKADIGEQEKVYVYNIVNGKASELNAALSALFNVTSSGIQASTSKTSTGSSSSPSSGSSTMSTKASPPKRSPSSTKKSVDTTKPPSVFDTDVSIFADEVNNRFLIKTTPRAYAMIKAILNRIDTVTPQVLLQVMIAEVTLSKSNEFGLNFSGTAGSTVYSSTYSKVTAMEDGLTSQLMNGDDQFATLRAVAGKGNTKVLSSPQIIAESHKEAKISVGDRVPILTSDTTDTTNTGSVTRSVSYEDTGVILTVTPHVTEGGLVSIEMKQEVSDVLEAASDAPIDSPTIQERTFETSLSVRDGGTVIVGGLIKDKDENQNRSIPWIIDLPVVRNLFGYESNSNEKTELVVLITAKIIDKDSDLEEMTKRYKESMSMIRNQIQKESK